MNVLCGICQDLINVCNNKSVGLKCGHVYHETCISKWLETRSPVPTCPHCRRPIDKSEMVVLHLGLTPVPNLDDPNEATKFTEDLLQEKSLAFAESENLKEQNEKLLAEIAGLEENVKSLEARLSNQEKPDRLLKMTKFALDYKSAKLLRMTSELEQLRLQLECLRAELSFPSNNEHGDDKAIDVSAYSKEELVLYFSMMKSEVVDLRHTEMVLSSKLIGCRQKNRELRDTISKQEKELEEKQLLLKTYENADRSNSHQPEESSSSPEEVTPEIYTSDTPSPPSKLKFMLSRKRKLMQSGGGGNRMNIPEVYDGLGGHSRVTDLKLGFRTNSNAVTKQKPFSSTSIFRRY